MAAARPAVLAAVAVAGGGALLGLGGGRRAAADRRPARGLLAARPLRLAGRPRPRAAGRAVRRDRRGSPPRSRVSTVRRRTSLLGGRDHPGRGNRRARLARPHQRRDRPRDPAAGAGVHELDRDAHPGARRSGRAPPRRRLRALPRRGARPARAQVSAGRRRRSARSPRSATTTGSAMAGCFGWRSCPRSRSSWRHPVGRRGRRRRRAAPRRQGSGPGDRPGGACPAPRRTCPVRAVGASYHASADGLAGSTPSPGPRARTPRRDRR